MLDRGAYQLSRGDVTVPLQRIPLELLFLLVERRGQLVTREEILERVWGKGFFVDIESSINTAVRKIRRALGDNPDQPRFVATVPARGYRFVAEVHEQKILQSGQHSARPARPMVGRDREMATLLSGLDDVARASGRLFLISGEPGVGKTRLADEVLTVASGRGMASMIGHCSQREGAVPYLPFVEILENFIDRAPDAQSLRAALGDQVSELARLAPTLRNRLPDLPPPLTLPPAHARRHLFNCFFGFAAQAASERGLLMILEDLHWADDSTLSLLDHLARRLPGLPVMLIGTYRDPGFGFGREFAKTLEDLTRQKIVTRITLKRLGREDLAAMLYGLSGKPPPDAIVRKILAETEGNPFFVEELFRYLEEENRLYDSQGEFLAEIRIAEFEAPPSVRLVVGQRLKRLSDSTQKMLSTAATIGRMFNLDLLRAASGVNADSILNCVEEAEHAGLIQPPAEAFNLQYEFTHELIRQAVIASQSAARRLRLHLEVAEAIERTSRADREDGIAGALEARAAELVHHYSRAGNPAKAAEYSLAAIVRFADLGSSAEAVAQFERALELLQSLPDNDRRAALELDLRNAVSGALGDTKGFASPETEQCLVRAAELSQRQGTHWEKTWLALDGVLFVYLTRPNVPKACEFASSLVALSEKQNSIDYLADSETWLACARMYSGDFERAGQGLDRAWSMLESLAMPATNLSQENIGQLLQSRRLLRQEGTPQNNRSLSAWNQWFLGYPDRARQLISIATSIANSGTKSMLADVHGFATYVFELLRDREQMTARAEARRVLCNEAGYIAGRALAEIYLGYSYALAEDLDRGLERMKQNVNELRGVGFEAGASYSLALIAIVLGRMTRFYEALHTIDEAFEIIERTGQRHYEAEVYRLKGELLLSQDRSNAARAAESFRRAIEISVQQGAKSWELRATTSLARMLRDTNRRKEARAMLSGSYHWFTEGFDTADMKDAKALLDELQSR